MSENCIFIVEDDAALRDAIGETLRSAGYHVVLIGDGRMTLDMMEKTLPVMIIADIQMPKLDGLQLLRQVKKRWPDVPVVMMTAFGTIQQAVEAMRDGARDYLTKPFEAEVLVNTVSRYIQPADSDDDMINVDAKSMEIAAIAKRVAVSDATIMITGESGSGKEVLARYIHNHSPRAENPFIAINCAAIPENMLESTLFGYEKGSFTGAYKACPGKFELANGGTLLLDEVSEMDLGLQAKLLRVIQEMEVERLGGNKLIPLDVRILATSNRNMKQAVREQRFREDLYYRLNVFPLHLPPLRERCDDIVPLAERFADKHSQCAPASDGVVISPQAKSMLREYAWPGNVRELENVLQRALIVCNSQVIEQQDILFEKQQGATVDDEYDSQQSDNARTQIPSANLDDELRSVEFQKIFETLKAEMGDRKAVAKSLGISQRTLRYKLAKMREQGFSIPGR